MKPKRITYARASALLRYDPETGNIYWRQQRGRCREGELAGSISRDKELTFKHIEIDRKKYGYGPIVWLLVTGKHPKGLVDFRNGNPRDTRWQNLILTNHRDKVLFAMNRRADTASGITGVGPRSGRWRVRVGDKVVGHFGTKTKAKKARQAAMPTR